MGENLRLKGIRMPTETHFINHWQANQQKKDHFLKTDIKTDILDKTVGILIIHPGIYSGGMERPTSAERLNIIFQEEANQAKAKGIRTTEQPISTRTEDRAEMVDPKVINLSSRSLNEAEINLLSKGLKFTPTPNESNPQDLTTDIKEYTRKIKTSRIFPQ